MIADDKTITPCPHCGAQRGWTLALEHYHEGFVYSEDGHEPWAYDPFSDYNIDWRSYCSRMATLFICRACGESVT